MDGLLISSHLSLHTDLPGASKIEEFLRAGHRPVSPHSTITDYLVFMRLAFAQCHCLAGRKRLAFDLFRKTRGTVVFARKRQLLFCLLCLPSALLRPALKLRAMRYAQRKGQTLVEYALILAIISAVIGCLGTLLAKKLTGP